MPTKHIADNVWQKVEKETYQTVIKTGSVVKETDVLNQLILKGIQSLKDDEDYRELAKRIRR